MRRKCERIGNPDVLGPILCLSDRAPLGERTEFWPALNEGDHLVPMIALADACCARTREVIRFVALSTRRCRLLHGEIAAMHASINADEIEPKVGSPSRHVGELPASGLHGKMFMARARLDHSKFRDEHGRG